MPDNNAADRLIRLVNSLIQNHGQGGQAYSGVLAKVLTLNNNDDTKQLYDHIFIFFRLIEEVERELKKAIDFPSKQDAIDALAEIKLFLSHRNLDAALPDIKILKLTLGYLKLASEHLTYEEEIKRETLGDFRIEIDGLLTRIIASTNIPNKLKAVLTDLLQTARNSIENYNIKGARGMREDLFIILSRLQGEYTPIIKHQNDPEVSGVLAFLNKFNNATLAALKIYHTYNELLPPFVQFVNDAIHSLPPV